MRALLAVLAILAALAPAAADAGAPPDYLVTRAREEAFNRRVGSALSAIRRAHMMQTITNDVTALQHFSGPLDAVAGATACWSLHACSASYAASNGHAVDLRGNVTGTFTINVKTNGDLDTATATTDCTTGGNSFCFGTKWYDQTGNGHDITQTTTANQPGLTLGCVNGHPCWNLSGSGFFGKLAVPAGSFPMSYSVVVERTTVDASNFDQMVSMNTGSGGPALTWNKTANNAFASPGTGTSAGCPTATDSAWHAFQAVLNTSSLCNVDGTDGTLTSGGTTTSTSTLSIAEAPGTLVNGVMTGNIAEVIWYNGTGLSSGQRASLHTNQSAYWGTP